MHRTTLLAIFAVVTTSAALAACGSDSTGTTSTTGGGGSTSATSATSSTGDTTTSTTSTTSTSGTSTSSASGTGGGGPMLVNGCDPTALEDHTKDATVEIKFGDSLVYAPPCIKVKSGTMVTFTGNTATHPLAAGEVFTGKAPVEDAKSPIKATSGPATVTFAIAPAGSYPYFCTEHYSIGMKGLIVAE